MIESSAVIVGIGGQDGQLLAELLRNRGYTVRGITKDSFDITNSACVNKLIRETQPKEVYFLAAYHHSSEDFRDSEGLLFRKSFDTHVTGAVNFLDAIVNFSPSCKFFYASSCLVFGSTEGKPQVEETKMEPDCPYSISKAVGMTICKYYRDRKAVFASTGILYNHESPLRHEGFVTRKIVKSAVEIFQHGTGELRLGNLGAKVDWGYAPDYVDAMHRILQLGAANDFVIATGETHTVGEFADLVFRRLGLDFRNYLVTEPQLLTRKSVHRVGDPAFLKQETGWEPSVTFEEMVGILVESELSLTKTLA